MHSTPFLITGTLNCVPQLVSDPILIKLGLAYHEWTKAESTARLSRTDHGKEESDETAQAVTTAKLLCKYEQARIKAIGGPSRVFFHGTPPGWVMLYSTSVCGNFYFVGC